jgi:hypothetical protein
MTLPYRTVFEVSYFSNGALFEMLGMLAIGLAIAAYAICKRAQFRGKKIGEAIILCIVSSVWIGAFTWSAAVLIQDGLRFTRAIRDGSCEVAEGTVQILHQAGAYDKSPGDKIRIGGNDFEFSPWETTLGFHQIAARGGPLRDGVQARLHYLDKVILKVEVAPSLEGTR